MDILIVEDEQEVANLLRDYLVEQGHVVWMAGTVEEALSRLRTVTPDLAILDLTLPDGNGRQVIQAIKERALVTQVVIVTACDSGETRRQVIEEGAVGYLVKPVTLSVLNGLLERPSTKTVNIFPKLPPKHRAA